MHLLLIVWLAICAAGAALSVRSIAVLGGPSPLTRLGWLATLAYFGLSAYDAARAVAAPAHADYLLLAALLLAFVVAGLRDEPQAEPWWWPTGAGEDGSRAPARVVGRRSASSRWRIVHTPSSHAPNERTSRLPSMGGFFEAHSASSSVHRCRRGRGERDGR